MPAWIIRAVATVALVAFSGAAGAACFDGHDKRMASEVPETSDSVTMSTHDDRVKLPAGESDAETEAAPLQENQTQQ